jgi:hypothetical protein
MENKIIPVVLSLFLLVPASIICAQTTYLSGKVIAEQDYRKIDFTTPAGNIRLYLPGDIAGNGSVTLKGTVVAEPSGKTDKEKEKNFSLLQKMGLSVAGVKIPVDKNNLFEISFSNVAGSVIEVLIKDNLGHQSVLSLQTPAYNILPAKSLPSGKPSIYTEQHLFLTGSNVAVYNPNYEETLFSSSDKFFFKDATGNRTEANILTQSPTQTVLTMPPGLSAGNHIIVRESPGNTGETRIRAVSLSLSAPNVNLRKGQTSTLTVTIDPKITEKDTAEAMQIPVMTLDIRNLNPNVIEMSGGNVQVMQFPGSSNSLSAQSWQATRTITVITPGRFDISADLFSSEKNTNAIKSQLSELKSPEDYNRWIKALKEDLDAYSLSAVIPPGEIINIKKYLPVSTSLADLDETKLQISYLLRYLEGVDKFVASGSAAYAAYAAARDRLKNAGPKNDWPLHTEIIEKGLNYLQDRYSNSPDKSILSKIDSARTVLYAVNANYHPDNLLKLSEALYDINEPSRVIDVPPSPLKIKTDGPATGFLNGNEIIGVSNEVEISENNIIIITKNDKGNPLRNVFSVSVPEGETLTRLLTKYLDPDYPLPGISCEDMTKICIQSKAYNVFWGEIYSYTNGVYETKTVNGSTSDTHRQSSVLMSHGWELNCCNGDFSLKTFIHSSDNNSTVSVPVKVKYGFTCKIPDCDECKKKCDEIKKNR